MLEVAELEFQGRAAELLSHVDRGQDVVVLRDSEPVAWLTRNPKGVQRREAVRRMIELREQIARDNPDPEPMTWEELKDEMRR